MLLLGVSMASESLTNEKIAKRFPNQFEMVNYLIRRAEAEVKRGYHPDGVNLALEVIEDVREGYDLYAIEAEKAPHLEEEDDDEEEEEESEKEEEKVVSEKSSK
jgi:hypothetical protein